ncbi:MAG: anti-sigma factor antagonist [Solirubrobacteraceae bacterium]|nr:anti-sigma factor antagonist [Solirubrobacteraceae bacterium]
MNASSSALHPFCVRVCSDGDEVVVAPAGELDLASAGVLEAEMRALAGAQAKRVVLDLRDVGFMDSTGLRLLISLRNTARRCGQRLLVVPGPACVQRLFELTGTRGLFDWTAPPPR